MIDHEDFIERQVDFQCLYHKPHMKTVEISLSEQALMMTALRLVNRYQQKYMSDPDIRKGIKKRIKLFRKMLKLSNISGTQYSN